MAVTFAWTSGSVTLAPPEVASTIWSWSPACLGCATWSSEIALVDSVLGRVKLLEYLVPTARAAFLEGVLREDDPSPRGGQDHRGGGGLEAAAQLGIKGEDALLVAVVRRCVSEFDEPGQDRGPGCVLR